MLEYHFSQGTCWDQKDCRETGVSASSFSLSSIKQGDVLIKPLSRSHAGRRRVSDSVARWQRALRLGHVSAVRLLIDKGHSTGSALLLAAEEDQPQQQRQ